MDIGLDDFVAGAAVVTDLLNTRAGYNAEDRLVTQTQLRAFLRVHGLPGAAGATRSDVARVRDLRDRLARQIGRRDIPGLIAQYNHELSSTPHTLALRTSDDGSLPAGQCWVLVSSGGDAADVLALLTAATVLAVARTLGPQRLRACSSTACTGMFLDTSRTGRRRFCNPERCGNRTHVARHRQRLRTTANTERS